MLKGMSTCTAHPVHGANLVFREQLDVLHVGFNARMARGLAVAWVARQAGRCSKKRQSRGLHVRRIHQTPQDRRARCRRYRLRRDPARVFGMGCEGFQGRKLTRRLRGALVTGCTSRVARGIRLPAWRLLRQVDARRSLAVFWLVREQGQVAVFQIDRRREAPGLAGYVCLSQNRRLVCIWKDELVCKCVRVVRQILFPRGFRHPSFGVLCVHRRVFEVEPQLQDPIRHVSVTRSSIRGAPSTVRMAGPDKSLWSTRVCSQLTGTAPACSASSVPGAASHSRLSDT